MTERADQLHHNNAPDYSTALVQAFLGEKKTSHHSGLSSSLHPRFDSLRLLVFPKAKSAVEKEVIYELKFNKLSTNNQFRLEILRPFTQYHVMINSAINITSFYNCDMDIPDSKYANVTLLTAVTDIRVVFSGVLTWQLQTDNKTTFLTCTRVGTLIVVTIYLQLIQNRYMFRSFTVLQCSHQHCVQPVASDVEVVGYL